VNHTVASAVTTIETIETDIVDSFDGGAMPQLTLNAGARLVVASYDRLVELEHLIQGPVFYPFNLLIHIKYHVCWQSNMSI